VRPADNFLFTTIADTEHNVFNRLVSWVSVAEIVVLILAFIVVRRWRQTRPAVWWAVAIWAGASALLMLGITDIFWEHLPKLKFVQIPWRWLVPFNVVFAIVVAAAVRRNLGRVFVVGMIAVGMFALSYRVLSPWWDTARNIAEMQQAVLSGRGYEGTDEYAPRGADPYEIKVDAPRVEVLSPAGGTVHVERWQADSRAFTVDVKQPSELAMRLFNYPAWSVQVNGQTVQAGTREVTGQMMISVPAGTSQVEIHFRRTPDRTLGAVVSLAFAFIMTFLVVSNKSRSAMNS